MSQNGKGDTPRPNSVDKKTFDKNWDTTFSNSKKKKPKKEKGLKPMRLD
jgi:hypothetical protein